MKHSPAGNAYLTACVAEGLECSLEFLNALNRGDREVTLAGRAVPLSDVDLKCIAEGLRVRHALRVLDLEGNAFGLAGVQYIVDALVANPGCLRELRLAKNRLKDPAAVLLGNALSLNGSGLKVLDLSENGLTKLGVTPIGQAVGSRQCDIVELSLHNNGIEADAALALSQAVRQSTKLRHLHLGYNNLRDSGCVQLARAIPSAASLSTLELTANRIGAQGGQELAKALASPNCALQRLNLRHNNFDDDTFHAYGDVILRNKSLTQLFLGFMKPSQDVAVEMISTLRVNHTLHLFDMYGWGLDQQVLLPLLEEILATNQTIRAIITDSCDATNDVVRRHNDRREERGWRRVYVGPDDAIAYQSVASKGQEKGANNGASDGMPEPPHTAPRSTSATRGPANVPQTRGTPAQTQGTPRSRSLGPATQQQQQESTPQRTPLASRPLSQSTSLFPNNNSASDSDDLDQAIRDVESAQMDPDARKKVVNALQQLKRKIEANRSQQQRQITSLEDRVRALEGRQSGVSNQNAVPAHQYQEASANSWGSQRGTSPARGAAQQRALNGDNASPRGGNSDRPEAERYPTATSYSREPSPNLRTNTRTNPPEQQQAAAQSGPRSLQQQPASARPAGPASGRSTPYQQRDGGEDVNQRAEQFSQSARSRSTPGPQQSQQPHGYQQQQHQPSGYGHQDPFASTNPPSRGASINNTASSPNQRSGSNGSTVYVPQSEQSEMAAPPSEPLAVTEESPPNVNLQQSHQLKRNTVLADSPLKQERVYRKAPPSA